MKLRVTKLIAVFCAVVMLLSSLGCDLGSGTVISSAYGGSGTTITGGVGAAISEGTTSSTADESAVSSTLPPDATPVLREDVTFSEMTYVRPDIDAMRAKLDDLKSGIQNGEPVADLIAAYRALRQDYAHADSMLSLVYLLYAFDVTQTNYRDEYAYLQSALSELDGDMQGTSYALFELSDEAEALARETFGNDYVDTILRAENLSETSIQDLLDAEEQLTLEYDNLSATFTLLDNGTRWTMSDISNDLSLSYDEYSRLYDAYCAALNEQAGAIFLEQRDIREQIAARLGYDSYADFCYESYARDYTPQEVQTLHAAVKKYIAPVFIYVSDRNDSTDLTDATFSEQDFLNELTRDAADFSPLLDEPVQFMLRNNLYDFSYSAQKMDNSFTTYISDYRAPYIFSQWKGESTDITTVLHELGHFTNYYRNPEAGYSDADSLDLAEIDSQALVLLMTRYFDGFFGQYAQQATSEVLLDAMYSLLSGCMEDEFQQEVYSNPDMTLDEINTLYKQLAVEYGLEDVYGYTGTEWVLISHTFQTPFYYISYAVSIVPALELYELAQTDAAGAQDTYFSILARDPYASFKEVLEQNGLSSVFSDATIQQIAAIVDQNT